MRFSSCLAGASWALASAAGLAAAASSSSSLAPVHTAGNKFFNKDGSQFFIKGIAYQLSEDDPLVDGDQCALDAALMKTLGTNTIRVYHVDASADHTSCMKAFASAGIYVLLDLDTFDTYILSPTMAGPTWSHAQYNNYTAVMDAFVAYDNTLGFLIGNEVIAKANESLAAPFIKAATRDLKAYRDSKGYRAIPVGYSAADIAELRPMLQDYLTCGGNSSEIVDFFALNSYEWCDPSSYTTSGYANLESMSKNFPVPIFFSETGCNVPGPRLFADQSAIFGSNMVGDWSGSIIYEWIQEENAYGLISYPSSGSSSVGRSGTPTPKAPDFTNLKSQWASATPTGVSSADYDAAAVSTRACPASTASGWLVDGDVALPTVGAAIVWSAGTAVTTAVETSATGAAAATAATTTTATGTQATATAKSSAAAAGVHATSFLGALLTGSMLMVALWL